MPPMQFADMGNWIGIIILVLTVLGWIANAVKGVDPQGNPLPPRKKPKPQRDLRSEIEVFLEELQQPQARVEPKREPVRPQPAPAVRPNQDRSRSPNTQASRSDTRGKNQGKQQSKKGGTPPPPPKYGTNVPRVEPTTSRIGQTVGEHLADRVGASVQEHLSGGTVAPVEPIVPKSRGPHPMVAFLQRPEGMQQAIILGEILQRPKVLRTPRAS